jgi:hypothetical protein
MMIRLKRLDEREFASTLAPLENQWAWIQNCVATEFECDIEDISSIDTDDEFDLITVCGEPAVRIDH